LTNYKKYVIISHKTKQGDNDMNISELNFTTISNEELRELMRVLDDEKKRRERIDKRTSAMDLREALGRFLDSGANYDFGTTCSLEVSDVDVVFYNDNPTFSCEDVEWIDFNPFDREVLLSIKNELTRCIGNYEG
jgi:hypothetical protein